MGRHNTNQSERANLDASVFSKKNEKEKETSEALGQAA